jgi:hypothetical protein
MQEIWPSSMEVTIWEGGQQTKERKKKPSMQVMINPELGPFHVLL